LVFCLNFFYHDLRTQLTADNNKTQRICKEEEEEE